MALVWIEGFEEFASASGNAPTGLTGKYTVANGNLSTLQTGRTQGLGLRIQDSAANPTVTTPSFGNNQTYIIGLGFKPGNTLVAGRIFEVLDSSTVQWAVYLNATGQVEFRRGTTLIATSAAVVFATDTWCYLEAKVVIGNAGVGNYEIRVNGTNVLSDADEDTQNSANAFAQTIRLWGNAGGGAARGLTFDDWYVATGSGGNVTDFLGSHRAITIYPNAEGDNDDFTPSAGTDNSAMVDETPHDTDTTYVESSTVGHQDLYQFQDAVLVQIAGVQINAVARLTDATPFSLKLVAKSGVTTDEGSGVAIGSTSYATYSRVLEENPDTTNNWTDSEIDSAQFGIELA